MKTTGWSKINQNNTDSGRKTYKIIEDWTTTKGKTPYVGVYRALVFLWEGTTKKPTC